ncbi:MAG: hypothetical protein E5V85_26720 [Mesorhizobium sp.]|nr:MAG: hypothetical protein E5V85_26720 [Mesorhizobium sp.]
MVLMPCAHQSGRGSHSVRSITPVRYNMFLISAENVGEPWNHAGKQRCSDGVFHGEREERPAARVATTAIPALPPPWIITSYFSIAAPPPLVV